MITDDHFLYLVVYLFIFLAPVCVLMFIDNDYLVERSLTLLLLYTDFILFYYLILFVL